MLMVVHQSTLQTHSPNLSNKKNAFSCLCIFNLHSDEGLFLNKATSLDHGPVMTDGRQPFAMPEVVVLEYSFAGAHVRCCCGVRKVVEG